MVPPKTQVFGRPTQSHYFELPASKVNDGHFSVKFLTCIRQIKTGTENTEASRLQYEFSMYLCTRLASIE